MKNSAAFRLSINVLRPPAVLLFRRIDKNGSGGIY